MADIVFKSNVDKVKAEFDKAIKKSLVEIGITVAEASADRAPVDTGRLRNDTASYPHERDVVVGYTVEYAPNQELGTSRMKAQPYLRPAVNTSINDIKKILEQELGK